MPVVAKLRSRPSRVLAGLLPLGLLLAAPVQAQEPTGEAAADPAPDEAAPDTWYAFALTSGTMGTAVVHYWSKGRKLRAETVISGHPIVTLVDESSYTMLDILRGTGTRVARSEKSKAEDADRDRPFATDLADVLREGGEKVRSEEVGGQSLDVYRVTNERGRRTVWVDPRRGLPLRVEVFDRQTSRTSRIDYLGWASGLPIGDRFFAPPEHLAIRELRYDEFASRSAGSAPTPVFYGDLLHGRRP